MMDVTRRDIDYTVGGARMRGLLVAPRGASAQPAVVLMHDAFGLSEHMIAIAEELAAFGVVVFAADVWGDRTVPRTQSEIGSLIGSMAGNRSQWLARVIAAHRTASAQPEVDAERTALLGYCFGGSSALEFLRNGGRARAVLAIHPGLDLLESDWSDARASGVQVHLAVGSVDPMATRAQIHALEDSLTAAGADWELALYSGTTHAFTSPASQNSPAPELFAYHARNSSRAWKATLRVLDEVFPRDIGAEPNQPHSRI